MPTYADMQADAEGEEPGRRLGAGNWFLQPIPAGVRPFILVTPPARQLKQRTQSQEL